VSECYPNEEKYLIRIRSKRAGRVVEELTGSYNNSIELEAKAAVIWNQKCCLSDEYGLRVYRAIGNPARWNKVDQIGIWPT
jgi:hypothetical protein